MSETIWKIKFNSEANSSLWAESAITLLWSIKDFRTSLSKLQNICIHDINQPCIVCTLLEIFDKIDIHREISVEKLEKPLFELLRANDIISDPESMECMDAITAILNILHCCFIGDLECLAAETLNKSCKEQCPAHSLFQLKIKEISTCKCGASLQTLSNPNNFCQYISIFNVLSKASFEKTSLLTAVPEFKLKTLEIESNTSLKGKLMEIYYEKLSNVMTEQCEIPECKIKRSKVIFHLENIPKVYMLNIIWSDGDTGHLDCFVATIALSARICLNKIYENSRGPEYTIKGILFFGNGRYEYAYRELKLWRFKGLSEQCGFLELLEEVTVMNYHPVGVIYVVGAEDYADDYEESELKRIEVIAFQCDKYRKKFKMAVVENSDCSGIFCKSILKNSYEKEKENKYLVSKKEETRSMCRVCKEKGIEISPTKIKEYTSVGLESQVVAKPSTNFNHSIKNAIHPLKTSGVSSVDNKKPARISNLKTDSKSDTFFNSQPFGKVEFKDTLGYPILTTEITPTQNIPIIKPQSTQIDNKLYASNPIQPALKIEPEAYVAPPQLRVNPSFAQNIASINSHSLQSIQSNYPSTIKTSSQKTTLLKTTSEVDWKCTCGKINDKNWEICVKCYKIKPGLKGWVCEFCSTFNGDSNSNICKSCDTKTSSVKPLNTINSKLQSTEEALKINSWKCNYCLTLNGNSTKRCKTCYKVNESSQSLKWKCSNCETSNSSSRTICKNCSLNKNQPIASSNKMASPKTITTWTCSYCKISNTDPSTICRNCKKSKSKIPAKEEVTSQPTTWTCSCSKINSNMFKACVMCKKPKPQQEATTTWKCSRCNRANTTDSTSCYSCGSANIKPPTSLNWTCTRCSNQNTSNICNFCGFLKSSLPSNPTMSTQYSCPSCNSISPLITCPYCRNQVTLASNCSVCKSFLSNNQICTSCRRYS